MTGIVAVALNPALDITYHLDEPLRPGGAHRVTTVHERAGGKTLNVANVLSQLGRDDVTLVAFLGGDTGRRIAAAVPAAIRLHAVDIAGETRRTVVVSSPAGGSLDHPPGGAAANPPGGAVEATLLNEPGPRIDEEAWERLRAAVAARLPARALVISGSNANGAPVDAVAQLTALGVANATPVFADTATGLAAVVAAGATVVKPNRAELAAAVGDIDRISGVSGAGDIDDVSGGGDDGSSSAELAVAARRLAAGTGTTVLASDGADGLLAVSGEATWVALPPRLAGNATGAGDATLAGFVHAALGAHTLPEAVRFAAACGAAAVLRPVAGEIATDRLAALLDATVVQRSPATQADDPLAQRQAPPLRRPAPVSEGTHVHRKDSH